MRNTTSHMIYVIPAAFFLGLIIFGCIKWFKPESLSTLWDAFVNNGGLTF